MSSKKLENVSDVIERLKAATNSRNDADLARLLGIGSSRIPMWKKRGMIDMLLIAQKCEQINHEWLLTGKGEMLSTDKTQDKGRLNPVQQQVNEEKGKYIEDGLKLAFHAIGRRMTPDHIVEGDFLIFDKTATPDQGDYVLVKIDDDGPGIVKWRPGDPPPIGVLVKLVREREVLRK
ncbi:MAG: phage repressor protein CI [Chlorobiales bacterium]|nr:phage repressor protein CI [Chlorobiales bacterium]